MKCILNSSGNKLEINALFIQPTRWCASNCKGCYVKAHQSTEQISLTELVDLFEKFYQRHHSTNQITISLDTLPPPGTGERLQMMSFYDRIEKILERERDRIDKPEVHVTVRDMTTFFYYEQYRATFYGKLFDMISFSNIRTKDLKTIEEKFPTHINYNHLCPANVSSNNIDKHINHLREVGEVVDSIYLILHKTPVGMCRTDTDRLRDKSRMRNDVSYMRTLVERLPPHIVDKINMDGCLYDVLKHERTGYGCSSNVSRFQVWPDGSVSGCPYAISGNTGPATTAEDIIENIKEARKSYDFEERCHLPEIHNSLLRRSCGAK